MKKTFLFILGIVFSVSTIAQNKSLAEPQAVNIPEQKWIDSVFKSLSPEEKIAQLIIVRAHSNLGPDHVSKVADEIRKYNVGALCFFQGGPVRQANLTNYYQGLAKTFLLVSIDAEWGLGMRLDSVTKFPFQLTLGALHDTDLVYRMGLAVGKQCKRIGVQINFAPVVDINNNPDNPVIGYRSFGENREKVSLFGVAYMKGMQDAGIMACAKHFPGHGDVSVDSHLDLPVIQKSMPELNALELKPFESLIKAGVGSVMTAHLYIPAIDTQTNLATSLSKKTITGLLRNEMKYTGIIFTDALEMKGITKYWPHGEAAVKALVAGNDMLLLPESVPVAIEAIKAAIKENRISWDDIDNKVKKVLQAKYKLGLSQWKPIDTNNLTNDLNASTNNICYEVAKKSLTVLATSFTPSSGTGYTSFPIKKSKKVAYIGIGCTQLNEFGKRMKEEFNADVFLFSYKDNMDKVEEISKAIPEVNNYDLILIGIHGFSNRPDTNYYGISKASIELWKKLNFKKTVTLVFGNVLAAANFCGAHTLVACYQDDDITQRVAADLLTGRMVSRGRLPVSVCQYKYGYGVVDDNNNHINTAESKDKFRVVDSIVEDALGKEVFPGCVILASRHGEIMYNKAFGYYDYDSRKPMSLESIFDLASVTKISATTLSVMKLVEQGKLDLNKTTGDYLSWTKGSNKAKLKIKDLLLHQAGLVPFLSFYKETIDSVSGFPNPAIYMDKQQPGFSIRVAEHLYMRNDWQDTMIKRILDSPLGPSGKYVYSDNDFIFLGKIVESITGITLDDYVQKTFYNRMGLLSTGFKPGNRFSPDRIVPTERENHFRRQTLRGDVDDEGAAMFGGVAGHAGLFSDAYDLATLCQMLLNGGKINGERYLKPQTIKLFTSYHNKDSRRGYGFDKPEKPVRAHRPKASLTSWTSIASVWQHVVGTPPYPSLLASPQSYGHTGFTGTFVWVDPKYDIIFILLSNRVNPTRDNNKISHLFIRGKILDATYQAILN